MKEKGVLLPIFSLQVNMELEILDTKHMNL